MKKIFLFLLLSLFTGNAQSNERFIPLELFTGGDIRDDTDIRFTPADLVFGEKRRKKIVGPIDWRAPGSKEIIKVYKRTNKNKQGRVKNSTFYSD